MKKRILWLALILLLISSVVATVTITIPTRVANNDNMEVSISGYSLYGIELSIPQEFIIVSDPYGGFIGSDGIYRLSHSSSLKLILRAPSTAKIYKFSGKYTEGMGVQNFPDVNVEVFSDVNIKPNCPPCPTTSTVWSTCIGSKQSKSVYNCNEATSFTCVQQIQYQDCSVANNLNQVCASGWKCVDDTKLALQKEDCTYASTITCSAGCDMSKNLCRPVQSDNLITGAVTGMQESKTKLAFLQWWNNFLTWLKQLLSF